jgi:hypothetical protein
LLHEKLQGFSRSFGCAWWVALRSPRAHTRNARKALKSQYNAFRTPRQLLGGLALYFTVVYSWSFLHHSFSMAPNLSNPTIMLKVVTAARQHKGSVSYNRRFRFTYIFLNLLWGSKHKKCALF